MQIIKMNYKEKAWTKTLYAATNILTITNLFHFKNLCNNWRLNNAAMQWNTPGTERCMSDIEWSFAVTGKPVQWDAEQTDSHWILSVSADDLPWFTDTSMTTLYYLYTQSTVTITEEEATSSSKYATHSYILMQILWIMFNEDRAVISKESEEHNKNKLLQHW